MSSSLQTPLPSQPVVFYDGKCGLCNRVVQWVLKHDEKHVFQFAPLQGKTALLLIGVQAKTSDTVMLWQDGRLYERSEAILQILPRLGIWGYQMSLWLKRVSPAKRDGFYNFIARHRHKIFRPSKDCALPEEKNRAYFLE